MSALISRKFVFKIIEIHFRFPVTNPDILNLWIKFTGRGSSWKPSRHSSICSRHFLPTDFREYCSRKCLKRNSVPTIEMKNSISYETFHISNHLNNNNNTTAMKYSNNEAADEYRVINEARDDNYNEKLLFEMRCRLCGERIYQFLNVDMGNLDDFRVDTMIRKCLPTMNISPDNDQSRVICSCCNSQLKQYSEFVDRIHSYQKDLIYSNCQEYDVETNQTCSATNALPESSSIFIKQEPVNVKQEKTDGSKRKPHDFLKNLHSTHMISNNEKNFPTVATKLQPIADFELLNDEYSEKRTESDREQMGSSEIMEIITLNNPVSFIDLAEDDPGGHADTKKLKMENLTDIDRRFEVEHAYAKRVQATSTVHHLKEEISEVVNENESGINSILTELVPNTSASKIMTCESMVDHQKYSPTLKKKECSLCGDVFESVTEYLRHKSKIHRSTCHHGCKRKFNSKLVIGSHERHCNLFFRSKHNLNREGKYEEKSKKKRFNSVSNRSAEAVSTSTVYASDLGKFVCSFCYRFFKRAKNFVSIYVYYTKIQ